jgi:hypothetical protein
VDAGGEKAEEVGCPQRGQSRGGGSPAAAMAVEGAGNGASAALGAGGAHVRERWGRYRNGGGGGPGGRRRSGRS